MLELISFEHLPRSPKVEQDQRSVNSGVCVGEHYVKMQQFVAVNFT
jgi:hypothetical protein